MVVTIEAIALRTFVFVCCVFVLCLEQLLQLRNMGDSSASGVACRNFKPCRDCDFGCIIRWLCLSNPRCNTNWF
jgi:hypothetical protein